LLCFGAFFRTSGRKRAVFFPAGAVCYNECWFLQIERREKPAMSAMDKMWASLYAIGLMLIASALITFARTKTTGILRFFLSLIAFLLLIPIVILMIVSIF